MYSETTLARISLQIVFGVAKLLIGPQRVIWISPRVQQLLTFTWGTAQNIIVVVNESSVALLLLTLGLCRC